MEQQNLASVLRIVALLIVVMVVAEYVFLDVVMIPPMVIAGVLVVLSVLFRWVPRGVAGITIVISVLVPVGAINGYMAGQLVVWIPIFDVIVFAWCLWVAIKSFRHTTL